MKKGYLKWLYGGLAVLMLSGCAADTPAEEDRESALSVSGNSQKNETDADGENYGDLSAEDLGEDQFFMYQVSDTGELILLENNATEDRSGEDGNLESGTDSIQFTFSLLDEFFQTTNKYKAGVYTSAIALNDSILNLEIVLDSNHINSIRLVNLDESITTMYPLLEPALASLAEQLVNGVELEKISYSEDKKFTQMLLMEVIEKTLEKAAIE